MIKILSQIVKIAPLLVALVAFFVTTFTFILIRTKIKNRNVHKTLKLFRDLKHEQQQLVFILSHSKDTKYKRISFYNYLGDQEEILNLMNDGKIDQALFNNLIKPQIIEFIHTNILNSYISEIHNNIQNNKLDKNNYKYLLKLIYQHNKDRILLTQK